MPSLGFVEAAHPRSGVCAAQSSPQPLLPSDPASEGLLLPGEGVIFHTCVVSFLSKVSHQSTLSQANSSQGQLLPVWGSPGLLWGFRGADEEMRRCEPPSAPLAPSLPLGHPMSYFCSGGWQPTASSAAWEDCVHQHSNKEQSAFVGVKVCALKRTKRGSIKANPAVWFPSSCLSLPLLFPHWRPPKR